MIQCSVQSNSNLLIHTNVFSAHTGCSPTGSKVDSKSKLIRELGDAMDLSTFDFQSGRKVLSAQPLTYQQRSAAIKRTIDMSTISNKQPFEYRFHKSNFFLIFFVLTFKLYLPVNIWYRCVLLYLLCFNVDEQCSSTLYQNTNKNYFFKYKEKFGISVYYCKLFTYHKLLMISLPNLG